KIFTIYDLTGFTYSLAQGIGVDSMYSSFDFGENFTTLKGCIIDGIVYGDTTTVGIEDEETPMATEFRLEQNYPNPFNPNTVISYQLPVISNVTLKVYDILGNEIATLVNEEKPAGTYEVEFNSHSGLSGIRDLPSGIYFYQLLVSAGRSPQTKKMVLLK
ncbi:MAG: T9SS C-terminal target domain-containing protein, partial [Ignavibacteria bacterium CHB3]|nr:T9SS C-terminal target domain-containing protein [Ignavibacteria bacterium CHB3]